MAAPTLVAVSIAATATGNSATSGSVSWQTSDVVVVKFGNAGAAINEVPSTPTTTGSGLTFTSQQSHTSGSNCAAAVFTAVASANSSGTITAAASGTDGHQVVSVEVWRGSGGVGNSAQGASSARTVNLTSTAADSAISWGVFDWGAAATVAFSPTATSHTSASPGPSASPVSAQVAGQYTYYLGALDDQTATGTNAYGVGGSGTGPFTIVAVEVTAGGGGGGPTLPPNLVMAQPFF